MTRKHFITIAKILNDEITKHDKNAEARFAVANVIESMSLYLNSTNANFNRSRFLDACYKDPSE